MELLIMDSFQKGHLERWPKKINFGVERELLELMPRGFVDAYEGLITELYSGGSLGTAGSTDADSARAGVGGTRWRTSTNQTETGGGARSAGVDGSQRSVIRDGRLLVLKEKIDRQLRKLARDITSPGVAATRQCTGCRRFCDSTWSWCPWCGKRTEEID